VLAGIYCSIHLSSLSEDWDDGGNNEGIGGEA
jgi:hypothetical protein